MSRGSSRTQHNANKLIAGEGLQGKEGNCMDIKESRDAGIRELVYVCIQ